MDLTSITESPAGTKHTWLRNISIAFYSESPEPVLDEFTQGLREQFKRLGHTVMETPQGSLDVLVTWAFYDHPVDWHDALLFSSRRRFSLEHNPILYTLVHLDRATFQGLLDHLSMAAAKPEVDRADYPFPGLNRNAYLTLYEQGRRAGPILSLVRLLQAQTLSIRIILVVGDQRPEEGYIFDLAGAYPRIDNDGSPAFYEDIALRMVTAASTGEVQAHEEIGDPISLATWQALTTPPAMVLAGQELGRRQFFTPMVPVGELVTMPRLHGAIASQYSEGCFATWEPQIDGLVATITGSARPVDKGNLGPDELSVIVGMRPDRLGVRVRRVEGKHNDPPSSEAVELIGMDARLPSITLRPEGAAPRQVPVARSKLHGHRGVRSYDPAWVEHVYLDPAYYHYPVSCSTEAQADAIINAFARSEALTHPDDPRQVVFTILPGHGLVIVEKWVSGKVPFQAIWEAMDAGFLEIQSQVPQGPLAYLPDEQDFMVLHDG